MTLPHVFTSNWHNDDDNSDSAQEEALCAARADAAGRKKKGVTGLKNWQAALAGRLPRGSGTSGIVCECRGV